VQVMFIRGYVPKPISSPELDALINAYLTVSDATAFSYMEAGHPMLQVNFPTAGKSWLFDATTGLWSPLEYGLSGARHRGEIFLDFDRKRLIFDYENGNIYQLDSAAYTDNGTEIASEIISRHITAPKPFRVRELYVDMETGVGLASGQGSDPQAMLQISKNGGKTWGNELWRSIGAIGEYGQRVMWKRLGPSDSWTFKIRITDPCKRVITYGAIETR
jgi:hypothetical protein